MPSIGHIDYLLAISGSFEITRPSNIPLHTWTSSMDGDVLQDDMNSGYWDRITPYFTYSGNPFTQSVIQNWSDDLEQDDTNMSSSLKYNDITE